ncbi:MAG: phosphoribosyltransferase [Candidatus Bathyarchaeia archaeon]|nr:phosphoribosyltransferase [Candidatus Bathyarchaeia archaeon]
METESEFEVPTWNQIYTMLLSQAEKIRQSGFKLDVIAGVTRGGLTPARILADLLEITDIVTVGVECYASVAETLGEPVLTQRVSADVKDQKVLLVDDVADTGKSLRLAREHLRQQGATEIRIATVYSKPLSLIKPNYYEKETCRWVVFPWDVKETIRKIVEKHSDKHATKTEIAKLVEAGLPKQLVEKFMKEVREAKKC